MTEARYPVQMVIDAVNKAGSVFRAVNRGMKSMEKQSQDLRRAMQGVNMAGGNVMRNMRSIAMPVVAAGGALAVATRQTTAHASALVNASDKLGLSTKALQEYRYAGKLVGIESNTMDMALQRSVRRLDEATRGGGEAAAVLQALGITLKDKVTGEFRKGEDLLPEVADAMAKISDEGTKVSIAFKLFDSEGVSMVNVLGKGSQAFRKVADEGRALGAVLDDKKLRGASNLNDTFDKILMASKALGMNIVFEFVPAIQDAADGLIALFKHEKWRNDKIAEVSAGFKYFAAQLKGAWAVLKPMLTTTWGVIDALGGLKAVAIGVAAFMGGRLLLSVVGLGAALGRLGFAAGRLAVSFGGLLLGGGRLTGMFKGLLPMIGRLGLAFGAFLLTPVGLAVAAIGGLVAAGVLLYNKFEPFRNLIDGMWQGFQPAIEAAGKALGKLGTALGKLFAPFGRLLGSLGDSLGLFDAGTDGAKKWGKALSTVLLAPITALADALSWVIDLMAKFHRIGFDAFADILGWFGADETAASMRAAMRSPGETAAGAFDIESQPLVQSPLTARAGNAEIVIRHENVPRGVRSEIRRSQGLDTTLDVGMSLAGSEGF